MYSNNTLIWFGGQRHVNSICIHWWYFAWALLEPVASFIGLNQITLPLILSDAIGQWCQWF